MENFRAFKPCTECETTFDASHTHKSKIKSVKQCNGCRIKKAEEDLPNHKEFEKESKTPYILEFGADSEEYADEEQIERRARHSIFWDKYKPVIDMSKITKSWSEKNELDKEDIYLLEHKTHLDVEQMKHISKIRRLQNGKPDAMLKRYQELTGKTDEEVEDTFNNPLIDCYYFFD